MPIGLLRHLAFEGPLREFVTQMPGVPVQFVTGIHLKVDEFALAWAKDVAVHGDVSGAYQEVKDMPGPEPSSTRRKNAVGDLVYDVIVNKRRDRIEGWRRRCEQMRYHEGWYPVVIIVDLDPSTPRSILRELPASFTNYPIRYRLAPPAEPFVGAGSGIAPAANPGAAGTLGGFLEDRSTGEVYAVTCEHVVGAPGTVVHEHTKHAPRIGTVTHSNRSNSVPPCNQHARPNAGTVDVALIKVDPGVSFVTQPSMTIAPIATVNQDDPIVFRGSTRRRTRTARVAAATIWKALNYGSPVCFGDIFMIDHRAATYVVTPISRPGDSGAWIVEDTSSQSQQSACPALYGMLIGGDRQQSYTSYAQHVLDWATAQNPNLIVP
jgi:hypothetical protein